MYFSKENKVPPDEEIMSRMALSCEADSKVASSNAASRQIMLAVSRVSWKRE